MNTPDSPSATPPAKFPTLTRLGPTAGRWLLRGAVIGFVFVLLYILSIGPAIQLNKRGVISPETLETLYFPLSFFSEIPGSQWLLDRYIRLWVDLGPEPG